MPKQSVLRNYRLELTIFAFGLLAINVIFIAKAFRGGDTLDPHLAAQLGDFVGGYVGSFFALTSVLLLVATLREQRNASIEQRRAVIRERFENRYFELIKMHRDNVAELEVQGVTGRRIFVLLLRELRCILDVVRRVARDRNTSLSKRQLLHVAYYCLFFGTGPNSSRMLKQSLAEFNPGFVEALDAELGSPSVKFGIQRKLKFGYVPFEGHQSRLGHYYRHLYQTVRYVDDHPVDVNKYEYCKTIRAQLTTHEQALLLINSLTPIGSGWWSKGFMITYRMVQNIPRGFFDSQNELDVSELFGVDYFEWQEVESAASSLQVAQSTSRDAG